MAEEKTTEKKAAEGKWAILISPPSDMARLRFKNIKGEIWSVFPGIFNSAEAAESWTTNVREAETTQVVKWNDREKIIIEDDPENPEDDPKDPEWEKVGP